MVNYTCNDNEVLDNICKQHYGREDLIYTVFAANPGLCDLGTHLPLGTVIKLPEVQLPDDDVTITPTLMLWD